MIFTKPFVSILLLQYNYHSYISSMLSGKLITLRSIEPSDVELLYKWENNSEIWKVSNTLTPFSKKNIQDYIENSHNDIYTTKQLRLMICKTSKKNMAIGCIDLFDFDPNHSRAGIGILIADKKNRNNNYASESLSILIKYCFEKLNLHQLYCNVATDNKISLNFFLKHKFKIVGKKKDWIRIRNKFTDEYLMQLITINSE
ncbi:MAG: GNAT family protein [Bacteroidota bacterium]